jgi:hypothetical protein
MSIGAFTDKLCEPSDSDVVRLLGSSYHRWSLLVEHLRCRVKAKEDFAFLYGKGYGWALRFRHKGKLLTSLFPNEGFFTVQVNLNEAHLTQVGQLQLHKNARAAIEKANLYPEGKWVFSPVRSDIDLKDVLQLIDVKSAGTSGSATKRVRANKSLELSP